MHRRKTRVHPGEAQGVDRTDESIAYLAARMSAAEAPDDDGGGGGTATDAAAAACENDGGQAVGQNRSPRLPIHRSTDLPYHARGHKHRPALLHCTLVYTHAHTRNPEHWPNVDPIPS